jgi:hypothetical protein
MNQILTFKERSRLISELKIVSGEPMENGLDWTKSDGEDMATPNRPRL